MSPPAPLPRSFRKTDRHDKTEILGESGVKTP